MMILGGSVLITEKHRRLVIAGNCIGLELNADNIEVNGHVSVSEYRKKSQFKN
jgi:hypothetical protein